MPVLMTLGIVAFALIMPNTAFLFVAGAFVLVAILSVALMYFSQRRTGKQAVRRARRLYQEHLAEREALLGQIARGQRAAAEHLYPDPPILGSLIARRSQLWERRRHDADFLSFRVGRAPLPLASPLRLDLPNDPMAEYEPDLHDEARALIERWRTIDRLPVVAPLADANVLTVIGQRELLLGVARSIAVQAAALRAPADLRVMASFAPAASREWEWLKWLPHTRATRLAEDDDAGPALLLATATEQLDQLLEEYVQPRLDQLRRIEAASADSTASAIDGPALLLILDDYHAGDGVARLALLREIETRGRELKVRAICLVADGAPEPSEARLRLAAPAHGLATLEWTGARGGSVEGITVDYLDAPAAETIARALAPLRLEENAGRIDLASAIRLTDLLPGRTGPLSSPLGLADDGTTLVLDLKEAAQGGMGPHGLVVGATGSGKSELLRTIVAGLAATHPPSELNFILADFKGGAAFAKLAPLPHVAGMITNLKGDLALVDRMYAALAGEMERRQAILNDVGAVDDIGTYRVLRAKRPDLAPLAHLLVIVDEFGELLARHPEFIELFAAIGRVGRSIGMYLLLSSQRLDEGRLRGLESHLRYRICLQTLTSQESKAVLGTPDAYLLPPYPGAGYLSVATELYQRFKTALITIPPPPPGLGTRGAVRRFTTDAPTSDAAPSIDIDDDGPTDLDALVERLSQTPVAADDVHQVWLPLLPPELVLSDVLMTPPWWEARAVEDPPGLVACVGLLDRPTEQCQEPLLIALSDAGGHAIIVGAPQTGKSTFLCVTLASLFRTYPPSTVQAYILDFGGGLLRRLGAAPHVGGVASRAEPDRVVTTVRQVRALLDEREHVFRHSGIDSMTAARARGRAGELPAEHAADVLLVIDDWGALLREHQELVDELTDLAVGGLQYGVHLIVSAGRWADVKQATRDAFGTRLELRLNDPIDSDFGSRLAKTLPANLPGRGMDRHGLHFQVALPLFGASSPGVGLGASIAQLAESLRGRWSGAPANSVRVLPEAVGRAELPAPSGAGIVLGLAELTLAPVELDLAGRDQHLLVLGDSGSGRTSLLRTIAEALSDRFSPEQAQLIVIDFRRELEDLRHLPLPLQSATRPPQVLELIAALQEQVKRRLGELDEVGPGGVPSGPRVYVLVDDYHVVAAGSNPLAGLGAIIAAGQDAGVHIVLARSGAGMSRMLMDPVITVMTEAGAPALLLSGEPHEGALVYGERAAPLPPGRARLLRRGARPQLVQLATPARRSPQTSSPLHAARE